MSDIRHEIIKILAKEKYVIFSELKRYFDIPSNKLAYYLKDLVRKELVKKEGNFYKLGKVGEILAPYVGHEYPHPLVVVLLAPVKANKVLLVKRTKEAYRNWWALLSKTLEFGEDPNETVMALANKFDLKMSKLRYERTFCEIDFEDKVKYHFIFLVYSCIPLNKPKGLRWFDIGKLEKCKRVIPTDAAMTKSLKQRGLGFYSMRINGKKLTLIRGDA